MLCPGCTLGLRTELADVPDLLTNLDVTRARLDQFTAPYGHNPTGTETPLPYRPHISEVVWVLHQTLGAWVRTLNPTAAIANTPTAHAQWLTARLPTIQRRSDAAQLADEVTDAIRQARYAIDRHDDDQLFLGPCRINDCREKIYGQPGDTTTTCPTCGAHHDIATRQNWMYQQARDHLGTAAEISAFLRIVGIRCTIAMIHGYALRKRLIPVGYRSPSPLYRMRDVIATIEDRYSHRKPRTTNTPGCATPKPMSILREDKTRLARVPGAGLGN